MCRLGAGAHTASELWVAFNGILASTWDLQETEAASHCRRSSRGIGNVLSAENRVMLQSISPNAAPVLWCARTHQTARI